MTEPQMPSATIGLLTHAPNDLLVLHNAVSQLPEGFPAVTGVDLQSLADESQMAALLMKELRAARILILRVLGGCRAVPGLAELVRDARNRDRYLIAVSGTDEPDGELAAVSSAPPEVLHQVYTYYRAGGSANLAQLLRYVSDHVLLSGFGFEPPVALPEHGLYHPDLTDGAGIEAWLALRRPERATVGIVFYRAHWISGNTSFVDALVRALEKRGLDVLPVFTSSLRAAQEDGMPVALRHFVGERDPRIDVLINTTSFAAGAIGRGGSKLVGEPNCALERLGVPVLQAITSGMMRPQWEHSARGLCPLDTAMNVALPEFDGRIVTVPVSFKVKAAGVPGELLEYEPVLDRVERVAGLAARLARLRRLPNREKRVAFVLTNSSAKASQIGNAVGLDAPASLMHILRAMQSDGYCIDRLPSSGTQLIHELIDRGTYDTDAFSADQLLRAVGRVPAARYQSWFADLPSSLQEKMTAQWGRPPGTAYVHDGHLALAGVELGNVLVALQPPRGYGMDPDEIYHQPDLPPTHHYYALYRWLRDDWRADAIVHVGKHGTLEWLPGKGVGLSQNCFPDGLLADMPFFYPFIINDPGEGSQAKRRAHSVVVDHLTPPLTTADTYGALAELAQLVDEYYQVEVLDPAKLPLLQQQIWELVKQTNLDADLRAGLLHEHDRDEHDHAHGHAEPSRGEDRHRVDRSHHEHGHDELHDHHHHDGRQHGHSHPFAAHHWSLPRGHGHAVGDEDEFPSALRTMGGVDVAHMIEDLDGYLCELGAAQIRDGLHILGQAPEGEQLVEMLASLTRLPNRDVPGMQAEVARLFGLQIETLLEHKGTRLDTPVTELARLAARAVVTRADALEAMDALIKQLFERLRVHGWRDSAIEVALRETFGAIEADFGALARVLGFACREIVPNLVRASEEIGNLLGALCGSYVPAGPSGAPTRGMAHILPTGRNFYSVDPRGVPSQSAWRVGQQLAHEVLARHLAETGEYPESVAISVWGTSAMRTHGDDVAQVLALLGVRPVWRPENRHLAGVEVIPLAELKRPRIDVTTRISGLFRDAFPQLIELIEEAVRSVIVLEEPTAQNFVRKHYLAELREWLGQGLTQAEAERRASLRIFGAKPGAYGAGILPLIQEKNWQTQADFARAYINWGGYAYGRAENGSDARETFRVRLAGVEVALHNQDNREHDIFDSDDYLQFHGGMIATIRSLGGRDPRRYFGDSHDPGRARVRDLKEEALRVFRSRVVNPKWLSSIQRHGYKGGLELTATVDYLFGYDATSDLLDDWMYEQLAQVYALDPAMQGFLEQANPWAQNAIVERLLEAAERGMWAEPRPQTLEALNALYMKSETLLEARGEVPRRA